MRDERDYQWVKRRKKQSKPFVWELSHDLPQSSRVPMSQWGRKGNVKGGEHHNTKRIKVEIVEEAS
jgi:hypothetical protein